MPATVTTAGTLSFVLDGDTYSCQIIAVGWSFVGEDVYTGCSPADGAATAGRSGDGATYELSVEVLHDWTSTGLSFVLLTGTPGEAVTYTLLLDTEGSGTYARSYTGTALIPRVLEEWTAGDTERGTITIPVRTRTAARYTA